MRGNEQLNRSQAERADFAPDSSKLSRPAPDTAEISPANFSMVDGHGPPLEEDCPSEKGRLSGQRPALESSDLFILFQGLLGAPDER